MRVRVLDLDGSITSQSRLLSKFRPEVHDLLRWGPRLRIACSWSRFYRYERWLDRMLSQDEHHDSWISLMGSGDYHHLTLAFLRRLQHPVNLLVLDKHPDWMRGAPVLHCGTWLHHAAQLPNVKRIFLVGGMADFENGYRWLAPKRHLQSGKMIVLPALRRFQTGYWPGIAQHPVRPHMEVPVHQEHLEEVLWPYLRELERWPLYVSLDKDVMWMPESVVNWDSGHLGLNEVQELLDFFMKAAGNEILGMDVVGDWSEVRTQGLFRKILQHFEHPRQNIDANEARMCNERTNLMLLQFLMQEPVRHPALVST